LLLQEAVATKANIIVHQILDPIKIGYVFEMRQFVVIAIFA